MINGRIMCLFVAVSGVAQGRRAEGERWEGCRNERGKLETDRGKGREEWPTGVSGFAN